MSPSLCMKNCYPGTCQYSPMTEREGFIPIYVAKSGDIEEKALIRKTDKEWREILTPRSFEVARLNGTEYPFTGAYHETHVPGVYVCICCGTDLFSSEAKFDSGTGWPSFSRPVSDLNVTRIEDPSLGMSRIEVRCSRCGAHLGHLFDDGPPPGGLRYCMNSLSLSFISEETG